MPSILLIDDDPELLEELNEELKKCLSIDEAEIRTWVPTKETAEPRTSFNKQVDEETLLVVTDYDLTAKGRTGLFGPSIIDWCQARAVPVGDFSRANIVALPKEPNLFELRVPNETLAAATFIAGVFRGFNKIREQLFSRADALQRKRSPAAVLADLLGVPEMESQFTLYGLRLGISNSALMEQIMKTVPDDIEPEPKQKLALLAYIVGHILLNAVLRFPGPILSSRALVAYLGCAESETTAMGELFADSSYAGPFSDLGQYFWFSKLDETLRGFTSKLSQDFTAETDGELNREAIELHLKRKLARHACPRCEGANGGFLCTFTGRTVCERSDCSIGSNSWIPQGARLCRIERSFYEEWAPILGI